VASVRSCEKLPPCPLEPVPDCKPVLAACDEDHGEAGCSAAVHGGPWWSRSPPVARGRDPTLEQGDARTFRPMERGAHAGAGLLAGLVTPWGPTLEQSASEGLHPVGRTHAGAVRGELHPMGRTHAGEVCGELPPVRGTSRWSRGRV